jgi:cytochrome c556
VAEPISCGRFTLCAESDAVQTRANGCEVTGRLPTLSGLKRRAACAKLVVGWVVIFLSLPLMSSAQDADITSDVIAARKLLMDSIMNNMDKIQEMISERNIKLDVSRDCADNIASMLTAFPHLFPPSSNRWREDVDPDPVKDTFASPDIWTEFADFSRRAAAAAATARELRRARNEDEVKQLYRALGIACDTCHALYMKE